MVLNALAMVPHVRTLFVLAEVAHSDLIHSALASHVRVMGTRVRTMCVLPVIANTRSVRAVRRVVRPLGRCARRKPATVSANA